MNVCNDVHCWRVPYYNTHEHEYARCYLSDGLGACFHVETHAGAKLFDRPGRLLVSPVIN